MNARFNRSGFARAGVAAGAAVLLAVSGQAIASAAPGDPTDTDVAPSSSAYAPSSAAPSSGAAKSSAPKTGAPKSSRSSAPATASASTSAPSTSTTGSPSATVTAPVESPAAPVQSKTGWVALADDNTKQMTVWHNGEVVKTMPISLGSDKHPTPNGTYYTMEKFRSMTMSSATYGVPVNSPEGYSTYVEYATRMSWDGIFVHAAPWSVAQQGVSNVSHGCINVSTANGKYVFDNFPIGTPIVVRNTIGGTYVPGS